MTLQQIPPPPALPPVPEPSGYAWGMPHLIGWRMQEAALAEWHAEAATTQAVNAMSREATLVAASRNRVRRITQVTKVIDDDPPTAPIEGLPVVVPAGRHEAPPTQETGQDKAPAGWDPKDKAYGTVKERGRRWLFEQLDADPSRTFVVRKVNDAVDAHDQIKGHEIKTWRAEWEASRVDA